MNILWSAALFQGFCGSVPSAPGFRFTSPRAYLIRDGQMQQLTRDHTLAEVLKEIGGQRSQEIDQTSFETLLQAVEIEGWDRLWSI